MFITKKRHEAIVCEMTEASDVAAVSLHRIIAKLMKAKMANEREIKKLKKELSASIIEADRRWAKSLVNARSEARAEVNREHSKLLTEVAVLKATIKALRDPKQEEEAQPSMLLRLVQTTGGERRVRCATTGRDLGSAD